MKTLSFMKIGCGVKEMFQKTITPKKRRALTIAIATVSALLLAGCGDSGSGGGGGKFAGANPPNGQILLPGSMLADNFSANRIDRSLWAGDRLEFVRSHGSLRMKLRFFRTPNNPSSLATNRISFINPDSVNSIQADVTINDVTVTDPTTLDASVRAEMGGTWYESGVQGDGLKDQVGAFTRLVDDGTGPQAVGVIFRCDDVDCNSSTALHAHSFGSAAIGVSHTLSIGFSGNNINFAFDGMTHSFDPTGLAPNNGPTVGGFKQMRVRVQALDQDGEGAYVDATFENAMKNGAPYDDFSAPRLDPTLWAASTLDFVREVRGGRMSMALTAAGGAAQSNGLDFDDPSSVRGFSADVTVSEAENNGLEPRARVSGRYFNALTASPVPGDATGDIYAETAIKDDGLGGLVIRALVYECGDATCATGTILYDDETTFSAPNFGESHTLSIDFDGTAFTFGVDQQTMTQILADLGIAILGQAGAPYKGLGLRVSNPASLPTDSGYIAATFDNVYVLSP